MTELTPEMQAHIELTRAQASHNYVPRPIETKPKKRRVSDEPQEDPDGDHRDSA